MDMENTHPLMVPRTKAIGKMTSVRGRVSSGGLMVLLLMASSPEIKRMGRVNSSGPMETNT